jgi:hypothetical protein
MLQMLNKEEILPFLYLASKGIQRFNNKMLKEMISNLKQCPTIKTSFQTRI